MILDILVLPDGREIFSGAEAEVSIRSCSRTARVNAARELDFGCACAAELKVQLLDMTGSFTLPQGAALTHYRTDGVSRVKTGTYYVSQCAGAGHVVDITAFDAMLRADLDLTQWLSGLNCWPCPMEQLLRRVCDACGLPLGEIDLPNGSYPVLQFARQVTARQLIAWVAGANARFAAIDPEGQLTLKPLEYTELALLPQQRKSCKTAAYATAPIDGVAIRMQEQDVGVVYPQLAQERYEILANPLLAALDAQALQAPAQALAQALAGISYTPGKVEIFCQSPEIPYHPGQVVMLEGKPFLIFCATLKGQLLTLESEGQPNRSSAEARYSRDPVSILQGQMNRLSLSVEGLQMDLSRTRITEVGGRNLIRRSQSLDWKDYCFSSGAALSDTATVRGEVVCIPDADPQTHPMEVTLTQGGQKLWLWGKNLLQREFTGVYTASGSREIGIFQIPMAYRANTQYTLQLWYRAENIAFTSGGNLLYLGVYYTDGTADFTNGVTSDNHDSGHLTARTAAGKTVQRLTLVTHNRWSGGTIEVLATQLEMGAEGTAYAPYVPVRELVAEGTELTVDSIPSPMTLAAEQGLVSVTYRRVAALSQGQEEGKIFPRFTIRALPESFLLPGILESGKTYTLSFEGRGGSLSIAGQQIPLTENWQSHAITFTAEGTDLEILFTAQGEYDLYHLQLERGSVPSQWQCAPEDVDEVILDTRQDISALHVAADRLSAQLVQTDTTTRAALDLTEHAISQLQQQVDLTMTAQQVALTIEKTLSQGAQKVVTGSGYTFDERGLTISGHRSQMENFLDHRGMEVRRNGQTILRADESGVVARDVRAENYLVVGDHARLENYDAHRTACFWL